LEPFFLCFLNTQDKLKAYIMDFGKPRLSWEDNIKMDIKKWCVGARTISSWWAFSHHNHAHAALSPIHAI
jgi:hypothetical protein